ncbi:ferritin-like domain-containing protein [Streptomyces sp. LMG1-1-1.1]|uniref:ferritin-like domain-containing protein n=1 Tax=Streptomyces sp. LMG1-1-1.1 TaxID=3135245 RepID=UPI00346508B3
MNAVRFAQNTRIVELMRQPAEERDLGWLKEAVQQAIQLELATLPPYLCGMWSIDSTAGGNTQVFRTLRAIVFDEMSHLGIACNLLTTIGGEPRLADEALVPAYPGPLPGGVRPELKVYLSGLTPESVKMYASIEEPDDPVVRSARAAYTSIGAFYTAILDTFRANPQFITGARQVIKDMEFHGAGNSLDALDTLADVEAAIAVIKEQGEGTSVSPENPHPADAGELAHYYAFLEIVHGRKLVHPEGHPDKWDFQGPVVPMPPVLPMGVVPDGGWPRTGPGAPAADVTALLDKVNGVYSAMLGFLEKTWQQTDADQATDMLDEAIRQMRLLRTPARDLMKRPIPGGAGKNYGPEFRFVAQ